MVGEMLYILLKITQYKNNIICYVMDKSFEIIIYDDYIEPTGSDTDNTKRIVRRHNMYIASTIGTILILVVFVYWTYKVFYLANDSFSK